MELDRGQLFSYDSGYGDYLVARADRISAEDHAERRRIDALRRETEWMRRGPPARTTKAKARIGRYRSLVAAAPIEASANLEFTIPPGPRLGDRVLSFVGVKKALGGRTLIDGLDLDIEPGTRLSVVGLNGAGKTTFLQLCMGRLAPSSGTISAGPTVRFAAIEQARTGLDPQKTVLEEIGGDYDRVRYGDRVMRIESFLEQFLFPGAMKHTLVRRLSGGERNRVLLAKLLCQGGNVILLDEPTNGLDLTTLRVLEDALRTFTGVVLVVGHDRYFLDQVRDAHPAPRQQRAPPRARRRPEQLAREARRGPVKARTTRGPRRRASRARSGSARETAAS
ncbi:MAG: ATP-binding cassette domain-containing protein [Planctomycetota bacterium]